jgi:hypothetical protein
VRYRAYCINYEPPGRTLSRKLIDELIAGADVCVYATKGIPIGATFDSVHGKRMRCVAHEHHGKIVILDDGAKP